MSRPPDEVVDRLQLGHDGRQSVAVDPGDPAALLQAALKARDLVGSFDKPHYITFTADICAHSRSGIVGCDRCLDLCPTGAIAPAGDHVAIDAQRQKIERRRRVAWPIAPVDRQNRPDA